MFEKAGTMRDFVIVATTTDDRAVADAIARAVVEKRLAACVGIAMRESVYRWNDEICAAQEFAVEIKTTAAAAPAVEDEVRRLHSYELPEILVLPIRGGSPAYLAWIEQEVRPEMT